MSEENEHTSEETDTEMNAGNHTSEQSKSGTSMLNNETEVPMLEDEEMPTYISVSSPSRREDADVSNAKQQDRIPMEEDHSRSPYPSDDQGGGRIIYVLSSGEESTRASNDEDDDEYADSEDMDEMVLESEHRNIMLEDEEDEDEEEDDDDGNPLRLYNDDDEDANTEYEQECFDRASDDFILNNRLKQHHKERSLSLQDLSFSKNNVHAPYNKKRHSINVFGQNYLGLQHSPVVYPAMHKKQSTPIKYQHVESRVKRYIKDMKERNRKSTERRTKVQEYITLKNRDETENNDTDQLKAAVTNKVIKDYAEKAIKDLQREENDEDGNSVYNAAQIVENGDNNRINIRINETQYTHTQKDTEMNRYSDVQNEKRAPDSDDKLEKQNGSVDVKTCNVECQNTSDGNLRFNNVDQPSLVNGHQQAPTLFNLRTLSYEEYMHGTSNTGQKEELTVQKHRIQEKANEPETYNEVEMMNAQEIENSNTSCPLKIENVKSIRTTQDESENLNFAKVNATERTNAENIEIIQLKAQLSQKDAQFHNLRNAYQKTLAENVKMKLELDALKESLAKYENENKTCKMKMASVQTESIVEPVTNSKIIENSGETNNKISTSSVASTISSIDHWADSACSPAISIKPPDLTTILNSDDSIVLTDGTPRKLALPLSRAFITSSRILQTLSNITQGKTKVESPLVRNSKKRTNENSTDQLNLDYNSPIHTSSSKKRKATDMLGSSTFIQPYKIPHTTIESEKKSHTDTVDTKFKYSEVHTNVKTEQQQNKSINKSIDNSLPIENQVEETNDQDDSVKCFIYREHENSMNRSFLIQAEEPTKDKLDNEKNHIQECGPYLLGNLEVRMSEINGTISVWGKEVSDECTSDNEDMEISIKSTEQKTCTCWQKTPQIRFNGSPLVCSTNKKQKVPLKLDRSNVSRCYHSLSSNTTKSPSSENDVSDKRCDGNIFTSSTYIPSCDCDSAKHRKEWPTCKSITSSQEKSHSCSIHHTEFTDKECNCGSYHGKQTNDDNSIHNKDKFHIKGIRRNSCKNTFTSDSNGHLHENIMNTSAEINEVICKYNKTCRSSLQTIADNNLQSSKCCSTVRDTSCMRKSSLSNVHNYDSSGKQTCSHSLSNDGEDDLLISPKRSNETPEIRQRRLSGKRVRGILMDLLRGCGDCRNIGANKSNPKGTSCATNITPQIKISPQCPTPEPICSSSTQCTDRCCHAYARRIESQLEEFRMEMERVRSRSDAILDMLNMLHSVDMN